jgi:hypothetical protein
MIASIGSAMGTIPPLKRQLAEQIIGRYCKEKVPEKYRNEIQMTYKFRGNSVTIFENRPAMFGEAGWTSLSIAQLRYSDEDDIWTLYCSDRNGKWHLYMECDSEKDIKKLIKEIDDDPICIFYG